MKKLIFLLLSLFCTVANAANVVNVYNWANYLPSSVLKQFQKETGISVNYSEYDSNETLYAKLKANPKAGYDIIVPSNYFVDRMRKQGMIQPLDKSRLTNLKDYNPELLNKSFDPGNKYSIPYFWGITGMVINTQYIKPGSVTRWADLWNPQYQKQLLMYDDLRDVFSVGLLTLGYSPNDPNPEHVKQAYLKLKQLLPNVKMFNSDAVRNIYIDEDATIGMGWNGDITKAIQENPKLQYIFPKEGFVIWMDCITITKNAPNLDNAYKFINFITRPDIAAQIALAQGYASPNLEAQKQLPKSIRENPIINPPKEILERGVYQLDLGPAIEIYGKYWEMLKNRCLEK